MNSLCLVYLHILMLVLSILVTQVLLDGSLLMYVYNGATFSVSNDPIYQGTSLLVLFHSINHYESCSNHYDAAY